MQGSYLENDPKDWPAAVDAPILSVPRTGASSDGISKLFPACYLLCPVLCVVLSVVEIIFMLCYIGVYCKVFMKHTDTHTEVFIIHTHISIYK